MREWLRKLWWGKEYKPLCCRYAKGDPGTENYVYRVVGRSWRGPTYFEIQRIDGSQDPKHVRAEDIQFIPSQDLYCYACKRKKP